MKTNMGLTDRVVRILIAVAIILLYLTGILSGTVIIILLVVAGIFILTSSIGFCPLYWPFRFTTKKQDNI